MAQWFKAQDALHAKYCQEDVINQAQEVLQREEQSEEAFLGAQGVLLLCGLL